MYMKGSELMKEENNGSKKHIIKRVFLFFSGIFLLGLLAILMMGLTPPSVPITPSGEKQMQAVYVTMKDGTRIAVRITLPPDLEKGQRVPAVIEATRYLTDIKTTFLSNVILKITGDTKINLKIGHALMESGYAYIRIDDRGSGASFGRREMEYSKEEIEDIGEVIDWIIRQPWSDGKVAAYGVSYSANTAELAAALNHPSLVAVAPLYADFEPLAGNVMPGGILNTFLLDNWAAAVAADDADLAKGLLTGGIVPVDGDEDERLLKQALQERDNIDVAQAFREVTYYDDPLTGHYTAQSLSPFYGKNGIQASAVPFYVKAGWLDAGTADGAIERFLTYSNSQDLIIGPWNHAGSQFYDPFLKTDSPRQPSVVEQDREVVAFFDRYLKGDGDELPTGQITYYTMGEGAWKTTSVWPVEGFTGTAFYFYPDGSLNETSPAAAIGENQYTVDFSATTGEDNRWHTQMGGLPIAYPDRAEEDQKLLTYTGEPLKSDVEITGSPVVTLNLRSTTADCALYVYLEAVAPDGKVIYITEGQLRALHRQETSRDLGRVILGPRHSYERADGKELVPGENAEMRIGLFATSVLVPRGYRLRIAVAGHDVSTFERIPADETPVIMVQANSTFPSLAVIPMKVRQ
jgi:putative CocE/NonD family hydrolase